MQHRHRDPELYFRELSHTTRKYIIPFIETEKPIGPDISVLEIGCGHGGNLLPFIEQGADAVGLDISDSKIAAAAEQLRDSGPGTVKLFAADFFSWQTDRQFDLVIVHDVIEHITDKSRFMEKTVSLMKSDGVLFMAFPAWQMPFGGHQQIGTRGWVSRMPFIHLLPAPLYRRYLGTFEPNAKKRAELLDIKDCGITVERFRRLAFRTGLMIKREVLYFINPHYEIKFGLKPRKLLSSISRLYYMRNFFSTSCFYLLKKDNL